jgi:peroxiredoxin
MTMTDPQSPQRRVVCAALRAADGRVLLGIRHYSHDMHDQLARRDDRLRFQHLHDPDQGFVDQFGVYLTREEAYRVANEAGQIIHPERCGGGLDGPKLYSEGLY